MEITRINNKPVHLSLIYFNKSLFFLIKKISGDSENEILSYFYELGIKLFNDSISKKKLPQKCHRIVKTFYKNSDIYVKFEVMSTYFNSLSSKDIKLYFNISFPRENIIIDGQNFIQTISETSLGLSDNQVISLDKPKELLYKCIKNSKK